MTKAFWTAIVMIIICLDQISKWLTETVLPLQQEVEFLPLLSLYRTYNEGVAFSFLSDFGKWSLIVLTLLIIGFVFWLWRSLEADRLLTAFGYAFVIGGAFGNLIDRIWLGKVIDMFYFHIEAFNFHFAIFNVADTFITLGAVAIIIEEFTRWKNADHLKEKTGNE